MIFSIASVVIVLLLFAAQPLLALIGPSLESDNIGIVATMHCTGMLRQ